MMAYFSGLSISHFLCLALAASASLLGLRLSFVSINVGVDLPAFVLVAIIAYAYNIAANFNRKVEIIFNLYCLCLFYSACLILINMIFSGGTSAGVEFVAKIIVGIMLISYFISAPVNIHGFMSFWSIASSVFMLFLIINSYFVLDSSYMVNSLMEKTRSGKNQLAFYVTAFLSVSIVYFLVFKKNIKNFFWVGIFFIHGLALIYLMSRSAWVCIAFLITTALLYRIFINRSFKAIVVASLAVCFLAITISIIDVSDELATRFESLVTLTDAEGENSISVRSALALSAYEEFKEHPFVGIGIGSFTEKHGKASHNTYLQYLSEMGLLGVIMIILLHMFPLLQFLVISIKKKSEKAFIIFLGVASLSLYGLSINIQNSPMWLLSIALFYRFYRDNLGTEYE